MKRTACLECSMVTRHRTLCIDVDSSAAGRSAKHIEHFPRDDYFTCQKDISFLNGSKW